MREKITLEVDKRGPTFTIMFTFSIYGGNMVMFGNNKQLGVI